MVDSYESEFIFIGKGDESFLENYSYELSDDPDNTGGAVYMALEILNNQAEAEDIGEAIFANFKQKFYEDVKGDPFERFEVALKEANVTIETLKEEKVSRFIGNLNVALAAVVDGTLYLSATGDAEVYLIRKRFVSVVSEGLAEESSKETFVNVANGTLEAGDRVVLASTRLLRYITKTELGRVFSEAENSNIGNALTALQDFIMTEILGRSAVVGISTHADKETEEMGGVFEEDFQPARGGLFAGVSEFLEKISSKLPKAGFMKGKFGWLSGLADKLKSVLPAKLLPHRESESRMPQILKKMSREKILALAVVLLLVLVGGIYWMRTRGDQLRAIAEQQSKLNHARELMNDASTVGQFDKAKASELLTNAEKQAFEVLNTRLLPGDAVKTLDDIKKYRDSLDDIKRVANPTLLADFSDKRPNVSALGMLVLKDHLFGFEYNALYEMVLDKLQEPLTISDVETVILGADYEEGNSLLFLTRTGKMIEYIGGRFPQINTKDGIWKKGVDMKSYNDKVYILDPERNQIWRYPRLRDTFDIGTAYNQNADLKLGVSVAVDSSVYVLNSNGTITQLYQGQKQDYQLRKAPLSPLTAPTKIFTNSDLNYLFILEPSKQRVILFRKDSKNGGAQYQTQYIFEKTGVLRDLAVVDNRLYVMDDKKVYFVNLSGL
ncbi:hypothetical protein HZA42_00815 [Candidatus Peregrinibacteria bacterium]|nr:hypothetical protein [Candidatus Peregrinibacteria bacterium]